jgi:hypothetical protein
MLRRERERESEGGSFLSVASEAAFYGTNMESRKHGRANSLQDGFTREYYRGKYHCTVNLLFDWFGISRMTTDNPCFYLQNRLFQTSQTGGQWYSDTSPFSIPWFHNRTNF